MKNLFLLLSLKILSISANAQKPNSAVIPANHLDRKGWRERYEHILEKVKSSDPKLILIGNSIMQNLDNPENKIIWDQYLVGLGAINIGISGDRTGNVIWRLQNGCLEGIHPKAAILLIGTNNTVGNNYPEISTPEELDEGIWRICAIIREKLPETEIILPGFLHYGYNPNYRNEVKKATNKIISVFPDKDCKNRYHDPGYLFPDENGSVNERLS